MSAWLEITKEVYQAGGSKPVNLLWNSPKALDVARQLGLLAPAQCRGHPAKVAPVVITRLGRDLVEQRVQQYVPYVPSANGGRTPGTHRRWRATWLMPLPRPNEVRLTGPEHRAQNDGTCYW